MPLFYSGCTLLMKALLLSLSRWQVNYQGEMPKSGPLIIAANHVNMVDPPLLSASIPRRIVFMAKREIYFSPGGIFVRLFGAFPVRRGEPDRQALRQAEAVLREGLALGMFPEGTRSRTAQMQRPKAGTSLIALRSGAPIVPVGITGTEAISGLGFIFRRPKITVNVGRPFTLPPQEGKLTGAHLDQLSDFIMERVAELLPEGYRGVYGRSKDG